MRYSVDTAPTIRPVTLTDVKTHLRVFHSNDDRDISKILDSAVEECESITRRKFMEQTILYYLDGFPTGDEILLPFGNLTSVTSVKYTDSDGSQSTMSSAEYTVDTTDCRIVLNYGEAWATDPLATSNPVEIEYVCGWATRAEVPPTIVQAIKQMCSQFSEFREPHITGTIITPVPMSVTSLLMQHRFWRVYP